MNTGIKFIDDIDDEMQAQQTYQAYVKQIHAAREDTLVDMPVAYLRFPEKNPFGKYEDSEIDALAKSLESDPDFLKYNLIVINKHEGEEGLIIMGKKRVLAAMRLGWEKILVKFANVDEKQRKAWDIKGNKHIGDWDSVVLQEQLLELQEVSYDIETLGFNEEELVEAVNYNSDTDPSLNPDSALGTTGKAKSKDIKVCCPNCENKFKVNKKGQIIEEDEE